MSPEPSLRLSTIEAIECPTRRTLVGSTLKKLRWSTASLLTMAILILTSFEMAEGAAAKNRKISPRPEKKIDRVQQRVQSPIGGKTWLAEFNTSPFPYDGIMPNTNT